MDFIMYRQIPHIIKSPIKNYCVETFLSRDNIFDNFFDILLAFVSFPQTYYNVYFSHIFFFNFFLLQISFYIYFLLVLLIFLYYFHNNLLLYLVSRLGFLITSSISIVNHLLYIIKKTNFFFIKHPFYQPK